MNCVPLPIRLGPKLPAIIASLGKQAIPSSFNLYRFQAQNQNPTITQLRTMTSGAAPQWWDAFPKPQATCEFIEPEEVKDLIEKTQAAGKDTVRDFLLVDVRRTDLEGGTIATSVNLPAQSFYVTRPAVYQLCKQAGVKRIIFYCGSCGTRGPRSANWMQDFLNEVGESDIKALILAGGVKGWQKAYGGELMDGYDAKAWTN